LPVIHPEEDTSPADLIIVALKNHHLPESIPDLKSLIGDSTTIISVMNGLDSEQYIGSIYGMDKVLYAISVGIDAVRQESTYLAKRKTPPLANAFSGCRRHLIGQEFCTKHRKI